MPDQLDPDLTLDQPPLPNDTTLTVSPATRSDLGPSSPTPQGYEMLEEIGRGGMGVVYKARQRSLNRIVALKVILAAAHSSSAQHHRFRAEATAVASLQHPNIVQVYETGDLDGQPYMALEYMEGGSLADFLRGEPQLPAVAAELVRTLAAAVQHAHERQIVHRDLKPANVLLASKFPGPAKVPTGLPTALKITDFGLAKQGVESHLTASGAILGTPSYMAPEQAAGTEAGPSVDIYALGGILYECLVGRPPFRSTTPMDTILQVLHDDPIPLRQIQPTVPHDLETICLKCLAKKPEQRYATAADLAADLTRFLDGEPIQARPVGRITKAWKWAKRHPALASAAFIFAVPLPAMLALMVFLFIDARSARVNAEQARMEAEAAQQKADREREVAQGYLKSSITTVDNILERVCDHRLARIPGFHEEREAILDEGAALYEALLRVDSTDPVVRHESAQAHSRMALLGTLGGRPKQAIQSAQSAVTLLTELTKEFPDNVDYRHDLARAYQQLSSAKVIVMDNRAAIDAAQRSAAIFGQLLQEHPDNLRYRLSAAKTNHMMAMFFSEQNPTQATKDLNKAIEHAEFAYNREPNTAEYRVFLAYIYASHAKQLMGYPTGGIQRAPQFLKRAKELLAIPTDLAKLPRSARTFFDLAHLYSKQADGTLLAGPDPKAAIPLLRDVAEEYEAMVRGLPQSFPYRVQAMQAYLMLNMCYKKLNQQEDVLRVSTRALEIIDSILKDVPESFWLYPHRYNFNADRTVASMHTGKIDEASKSLAEYERNFSQTMGANAYNIGCLHAILASKCKGTQHEELAATALKWLKRAADTGYPSTAKELDNVTTTDTDLKTLRQRPDFQVWVKQLKIAPKK